jgi:UDP-N-acetylglucosamine acyltransferase
VASIHATADVHPGAQLASDVTVGPFAVLGEHVRIGAGCQIGAHAMVQGHTTLGERNVVHPFACLGGPPQDKKYAGEPTQLLIGHGNTFREYVTINTGTVQDQGVTRVGDDNWIMAYVHIAHDCRVGSHVILANAVQLAGHVQLDDWVFLGGLTGVHQFVRVGAHAMSAFQSRLTHDVPPYVTVAGNPCEAVSVNSEGLKRRGFSSDRLMAIKRLYKALYRSESPANDERRARVVALHAQLKDPIMQADAALMLDFLAQATRGLGR